MLKNGVTVQDAVRDHSSRADMVAKFFNTDAFVATNDVPRGVHSNAGRDLISGPASNTDFSVLKHFAVREPLKVQETGRDLPDHPGVAILIAEMDGSMVPQVETAEPVEGEAPIDRRKTRKVSWTEALLCLVHEPGSVTPVFGATMGYRKRSWRSSVGVRY